MPLEALKISGLCSGRMSIIPLQYGQIQCLGAGANYVCICVRHSIQEITLSRIITVTYFQPGGSKHKKSLMIVDFVQSHCQ